ncbi:uncharacterized protein L199_002685 [Kwoniella botswanensis]|uniref:uncharacterized protein n=1 Tax=Kwoniella botswanensis TaxID=1268659 RepID=UPI00315D39F7
MFNFRSKDQNTPTKKPNAATEENLSDTETNNDNNMSEKQQERKVQRQQNGNKPPNYDSGDSEREGSDSEAEEENDGPLDGLQQAGEAGQEVADTANEVTDQATDTVQGVTKTADQATSAIKDVALNPLGGKKRKQLSQTIGEENLKNVGKKNGKDDDEGGSLRIRIQLDLDVEVHLSARIKGDITIGLL